jgi:hypothetical protein
MKDKYLCFNVLGTSKDQDEIVLPTIRIPSATVGWLRKQMHQLEKQRYFNCA